MRPRFIVAVAGASCIIAATAMPAAAQSEQRTIELTVNAGRPLRVALDERVQLKRVGQVVTGTVMEPVYAYDRIVMTRERRYADTLRRRRSYSSVFGLCRRQPLPDEACDGDLRHLLLDMAAAAVRRPSRGTANATQRGWR